MNRPRTFAEKRRYYIPGSSPGASLNRGPTSMGYSFRHVLRIPIRLRSAADRFAPFLRQPRGERLGIEPTDIDDRTVASSPFSIVGPVLATAVGDASIPLVERHLVSADGEGFR